MATCSVYGTFTDPNGSAISGATVRFNIETPVVDLSGKLLMPKEITTTTASDGTWSLSITQNLAGNLALDLNPALGAPSTRYNFSLIVPSTTTASFASCWVESATFGGQTVTTPLTFSGIAGSLDIQQLTQLPAGNILIGNSSNLSTVLPVTGDVSLSSGAVSAVVTVGGSTAANVHSAELLANAATNANTASTLVKRDASGNFTAGTITAGLVGNVTGNATTATTSSSLSGSLTGDVTGTQSSTHVTAIQGYAVANTTPTNAQVQIYNSTSSQYNPSSLSGDVTITNSGAATVGSVGGSSAANVHTSELATAAATSANTVSTIVKRDSSGNFSAGTVTASLTGTASGNTSYTANNHGVVLSGSANSMTVLAPDSSTAKTLVSGGASADPSWAVLTVPGGGSGVASTTAYGVVCGGTTTTGVLQNAGAGTTGQVLTSNGASSLPTWQVVTATAPNSEVFVTGGSGHGSTNTKVRRFTTSVTSSGTDITYTSSATNGDSFTANTTGIYAMTYCDNKLTTAADLGISKNSSQLTTNIGSITNANRLGLTDSTVGSDSSSICVVTHLTAADVVRVHTDGTPDGTSDAYTSFRMTRIG